MLQVLKFGGSSVESATNMSRVLDIVEESALKGRVVLICSAIKGCTDALLELSRLATDQKIVGAPTVALDTGSTEAPNADIVGLGRSGDVSYSTEATEFADKVWALKKRHLEIIRRLFTGVERKDAEAECHSLFAQMVSAPPQEMVTYGEVFTTRIIARKLACDGIMTKWLDSTILVIKEHKDLTYSNIHAAIALHPEVNVFVAPGFIASTYEGARTTLGRGGSDLSASIYAAALHADSLQIWSDVPGMMSANPKDVPTAQTIPFISYRAALDMATNGAKVLYAPAVEPAMQAGIEMNLRNTFDPANPGTLVSKVALKGWAGVASVKVLGGSRGSAEPSREVALAESKGQTGNSKGSADKVAESRVDSISKLCLVAESPQNYDATQARIEDCLRKAGIKALDCTCSENGLNVYVTIKTCVEKQALRAIHHNFFEEAQQNIVNIYVAGFGAVAKAFLQMLAQRADSSQSPKAKVIRLCGLSNSHYYIIDNNGINPTITGDLLNNSEVGQATNYCNLDTVGFGKAEAGNKNALRGNASNFAVAVMQNAPRHSIFVDLTNSVNVYKCFEALLGKGINIVTSNRRSLAVPFVEYAAIMATAAENGCFVRYETTVGSALPLLDGISRSANTGEEILSIEAVVSCTLNRILSSYARYPGSFASTVKKAQEEGLAEADIREDLTGKDALRKLLILARQAGVPLEEEDVLITPVVPAELLDLPIEEFYNRLEELEPEFDAAEKAAARSQCRQRFIATLERVREGEHQTGQGRKVSVVQGSEVRAELCQRGKNSIEQDDPEAGQSIDRQVGTGQEQGTGQGRHLGYKAHIAVRNVPRNHPAFRILGTENAIIVRSAYHPYPLVIQGAGEGARMAASSVLNEILK